MTCPRCGRSRTAVTYTINSDQYSARKRSLPPNTIRRQRLCPCGHKFLTIETHEKGIQEALRLIHVARNAQTTD